MIPLESGPERRAVARALASSGVRERDAQALSKEEERAQCTLDSIADALISTDLAGRVTYLNVAAEQLTGWLSEDAIGQRIMDIFQIIDAESRVTVPSPVALAIQETRAVSLPLNCVLKQRDGSEKSIEYSATPIRSSHGPTIGAIVVFYDVGMARALSLEVHPFFDPLTRLPNGAMLADRISQAISIARENSKALAIIYLGLDFFKHVNDSLGHPIGDRLLQSVAGRCSDQLRTSDTMSRRGDEFVILLSEVTQAQDAAISAEALLQAVCATHRIDGHDIHITASLGIATYPDDGMTTAILLKHAALALRNAKDLGRNNYKCYRPDGNSPAIPPPAIGVACVAPPLVSLATIDATHLVQFTDNRLLAALPDAEWPRWRPLLEWTDLTVGQVLYESGTALSHAYFPTSAVIALIYTMQDGASAASALVGNDGVVGVSLFMGAESTPSRALVQIAGKCLRISADTISQELHHYGPALRLLLRYTQAMLTQMVQSAACHRHHSHYQQLCRWLLLSFDRLRTNEFVTTRAVLAAVLGTRGGHIADCILELHRDGVIKYADGHITLLERTSLEARSCECYAVIQIECARLLPNSRAV